MNLIFQKNEFHFIHYSNDLNGFIEIHKNFEYNFPFDTKVFIIIIVF